MQVVAAADMEMNVDFAKRLVQWFCLNRRNLPWRENRDPYRVWVSEIMLQQTRVEAVIPYYLRFMEVCGTVEALAACPEEKLLKLWEGLGYYSRARNLQAAARVICEEYGGKIPDSFEQLEKLPGIGEYTAGAVSSIAFGQPRSAVDGNVLRIWARLKADSRDMADAKVRSGIREEIERLLAAPCEGSTSVIPPGEFNQALMDLGACVCLPNGSPHCGRCPVSDWCEAHRIGREAEFPVRRKKAARRVQHLTVFLIRDGELVAVNRRPEHGLLARMYEFPNAEGRLTEEEALDFVRDAGFVPLHIRPLQDAKHIFTHIEWDMTGYEIRTSSFENDGSQKYIFAQEAHLREQYPIPSAFAAYLRTFYESIPAGETGRGIKNSPAGEPEKTIPARGRKTRAAGKGEERV